MNLETIDLTVGEARNLRDLTCTLFDINCVGLNFTQEDLEYAPAGYEPLIKALEEKHQCPIVITNGALQGLHAAVHLLRLSGCKNVACRTPYWSRLKDIVSGGGLEFRPFEGGTLPDDARFKFDSLLTVAPNNPDGYLPLWDHLKSAAKMLESCGVPLIHDAAYFTRSYIPVDYPINPVGDVQLFSASKAYGLSGLRIGYVAVHNLKLYEPLVRFMENQTVGVSVASQKLFLHIVERENKVPLIQDLFERKSREIFQEVKTMLAGIKPGILDLQNTCGKNYCGVFAWVKPIVPDVFEKCGIKVLHGDTFGRPGFVRFNLGISKTTLKEVVRRLNEFTQ